MWNLENVNQQLQDINIELWQNDFMKKLSLFILFLTSCSTTQVTNTIETSFNVNEIDWFLDGGNSIITGSGFMRTLGGDIKSCSGYEVTLWPVSTYADERVQKLYLSNSNGRNSVSGDTRAGMKFSRLNPEPDPKYIKNTKKTLCDVDGKFKFQKLAAGEYYLTTTVIWQVGYKYQGGFIMKRVKIREDETKNIVLTY